MCLPLVVTLLCGGNKASQQRDCDNVIGPSWLVPDLQRDWRICLDLAEKDALAELIEERQFPTDADLKSEQALDEWMMRNVSTSHHISGTCKMGPADDAMAVVDQYARMHGIEGLRVADAAIMPELHPRQYQRHIHGHWRARSGFDQGGEVALARHTDLKA